MALQLAFSVEDKCTTIKLNGSLNEYSSALNGVEVNPLYDLNIDLKDLTAINSLGIRNFQIWINRIKCQKLRLFYCPRVFIHQLNMVEGFLPSKSEIESFFVPYYSDITGEENLVLFTKELEYKKVSGKVVISAPTLYDSQNSKMEIDTLSERYFRFLDFYF